MTRQNYINEIMRQLNGIDGREEYWFHRMDNSKVASKIISVLCNAIYEGDKSGLAKVAAMCMIAMERADILQARTDLEGKFITDFKESNKIVKENVMCYFYHNTSNCTNCPKYNSCISREGSHVTNKKD